MDARETTIFIAILIGVAIIGGILMYFLLSLIRLHRRFIRLQKAKDQAEITLIEKERTRIAADLHDELGPILSAAKYKLSEAEPASGEDRQLLDEAATHIDNMLTRIRQIANGLMPNTLLRKGPVQAIQEFVNTISSNSSMKIELLVYEIPALSETQAICIYRILQEAIHNAIKHAQASLLKIQFFVRTDKFIIICKDNGIGFDTYKIEKQRKGLGLQNMLTRMEMISGKLFISSAYHQGTELKLVIPLIHSMQTNEHISH